MKNILWFRRNLRLDDNPLLAIKGEVLPLYIFDAKELKNLPSESHRLGFVFSQVLALKEALKQEDLDLAIFVGEPLSIIKDLIKNRYDGLYVAESYEPKEREMDVSISLELPVHYVQDTYFLKPDEILKKDGTPYLVFTPFYHQVTSRFKTSWMKEHTKVTQTLCGFDYEGLHSPSGVLPLRFESLGFKMTSPTLSSPTQRLKAFQDKLTSYSHKRDFPREDSTSNLSAHLSHGTLSIRQLLRWLTKQKKMDSPTEPFFRQLVFREYYAYLLYHFPYIATKNFKTSIKGIEDYEKHARFCEAKTGVPIVDAGIQELLQTGTMHNRVRMICASFYTKDLLLPWQWGEAFFAKYLIDYDMASNVLSWQWSAGTGIDPQPFFRIFNPYRQSQRFDKEAHYIKRFLPQLKDISPKILHDETKLFSLDIPNYPRPMLEHAQARQNALAHFKR